MQTDRTSVKQLARRWTLRIVRALLAASLLFLGIAALVLFVILALAIVYIPRTARIVRASVIVLREMEYVQAAIAVGAGQWRILFRHILPNAMAPVLVAAVLGVAGAILTESGLSFLGLGVQPPTPSWGNILTAGKDNIDVAWWLSFYPGIAITLTMLGYNMLGEGLRDALDPWLSGSE